MNYSLKDIRNTGKSTSRPKILKLDFFSNILELFQQVLNI